MKDFALLITWTCYGTWLPGDERGYVTNTRSKRGGFKRLENIPGTPLTQDDKDSRDLARQLQKHLTVRLSPAQAFVAAQAFIDAAREREWQVLRGAVMANHVHLVVTQCPDDGPAVRRVFKGVGQAKLNDYVGQPRRWWTQGGSDRYKHGFEAIAAAVKYVERQHFCLVQIERNAIVECDLSWMRRRRG